MTEKSQASTAMYESTLRTEADRVDTGVPQEEQVVGQSDSLSKPYAELRRSIRSYGIWMLISAAASLLPGFDIAWAAILLLIGLLSFYFYDAAGMLLVYAVTFLLAAGGNLLALGQSGWGFLGAVQMIWALLAYREYRKYRSPRPGREIEYASAANFSKRESQMVWLAPLFGAAGALGLCGLLPLSIIYYTATSSEPGDAFYMALGATVILGVLGLPIGIAAIGSGHGPKAAAIAGIALGTVSALAAIMGPIIGALGAA